MAKTQSAWIKPRQRGRSKFWYLYWYDADGHQRSQSLGKLADTTEAQARIALAAKQLELGQQRNTAGTAPTLAMFSTDYMNWHERAYPSSTERICQIIRQWLVPIFGDQPMDQLKRHEVEQYVLSRDAAPETVAKELRTLQAVLNKAVEWEIITRNPVRGVSPPKSTDDAPVRYLTRGELAAVYQAAGYRDAWWKLMVNTGMRRGEAMALRWEHVHDDVIVIVSAAGSRTKSGKSRAVPLNKNAREAVQASTDAVGHSHKHDPDFVFPRMNPRSLSRHFETDAAKAGIDASIHDLRHTFCSQLVLAGVHLRKIQQLAGHSTIRVTERYAKLLTSDLTSEVRLLEL